MALRLWPDGSETNLLCVWAQRISGGEETMTHCWTWQRSRERMRQREKEGKRESDAADNGERER